MYKLRAAARMKKKVSACHGNGLDKYSSEIGCGLVAKWVWFGVEEVSYISIGSSESSVVKNITKLPLPLREVSFVDLRDYC